jgi:TonB family protein
MRLLPPTPSRPDTAAYPSCAVDLPADLEVSPPAYPPLLRGAEIEGSVVVEFVVDTLGAVVPSSVRELSTTHELFTAAAVNAVRQWKGKPAVLGRMRVPSRIKYKFTFLVHCDGTPPAPTASLAIVCG